MPLVNHEKPVVCGADLQRHPRTWNYTVDLVLSYAACVQPLSGVTILVVDDDASVLHVVTEILSLAGATVHSSRSGVEAQRAAAQMTVCDLVLTDIVLPDVVGLELVDVLRRWHPAAKVILMSGNLTEVAAPPGVPALQKPFKLSALVALVQRTMAS